MSIYRNLRKIKVFLVLSLTCLLTYSFFAIWNNAIGGLTLLTINQVNRPKNFIDAIKSHAKFVPGANSTLPDINLIILAMTDNSFNDLALNLYLSSFKRFGIENFLFVGAGKNSCKSLIDLNIQCYDYWEDPDADQSNVYGSKSFIRKMNIRTEMILEALKNGYSVLHTDLDVVFLRNPMSEIENLVQSTNMAVLWDHVVYNAGFLAIKATPFSIEVYENIRRKTATSNSIDDQVALNAAIEESINKYSSNLTYSSVAILDRKRYVCGKDYFENNRNFPSKTGFDNCQDCMVVHNNWIISKEAKIYRFKESVFWYLDTNGYYSDNSRQYLLYYNPVIENPPVNFSVKDMETTALKTGLAIADMLNRTLIIPRFHCFKNAVECPLNSWFRITNFDKHFAPNYRESSFLLNPQVPQNINMKPLENCPPLDEIQSTVQTGLSRTLKPHEKMDKSLCSSYRPVPIVIITKQNENILNSAMKNFPSPVIFNFSKLESISETLILSNFGNNSDQVVVFSSLLGVEVTFNNQSKAKTFQDKLSHGLTKATYLQN